jgi:carbon-monoxide dehydrogenase iron sulfur subunit
LRKVKFDKKVCTTCHICEIACALKHSPHDDINEIFGDEHPPIARIKINLKKGKVNMQKCVFCKKPKCVEACEYDAIEKKEDGFVEFYDDKCTGCWECIEACPFDAISKNEADNIAVRCDLCLDADKPSCVSACSTEALTCMEAEAE